MNFKNFWNKFLDKASAFLKIIGNFFKKMIDKNYLIFTILLSFVLNIAIEAAARKSLFDAFDYIFKHPLFFLYNVSLITFTFSIALLCRKRVFSMLLILALWIAAGITNATLLYYRHSPFIAADFAVLKSAIAIMDIYLSIPQMILVVISIILVISALVWLLIKERKKQTDYRKIAVLLAVSIAVSVIPSDYITAEKAHAETTNITDEAYKYGFVCCFLNSIFNSGAEKPVGYSQSRIDSIASVIKNDSQPQILPNIVVIQLESFIDPYKISGVEYSKDPVPNYRNLKENYTSGLLNVAVYGGGTANTEFEVLTGMNLRYFGIGEYPYETLVESTPTESISYNLKDIGYTTHAIHNHTGTFYDRNIVYANLGFDTFIPYEYMNGIEYNELGWEKSNVLTKEIFKSLSSTDGQDFVFTVTSQCHGKYPEWYKCKNFKIKCSEETKEMGTQIEYFIDQLYDEDKWLGEFIEELKDYPEPVMAVIYGDHMPALPYSEEMMNDISTYQTEYIIWTNYPQTKENVELSTFNLMSKALQTVGISSGNFTKLHQYSLKNDINCSDELKNLQYDVTEGKGYIYGKNPTPFEKTDMKLGIDEIIILDVIKNGNTTTIKGENFTKSSVVFVDGESVKTQFISPTKLIVNSSDCKNYEEITVAQRATNLTVLGYSKPYKKD